MKSSTNVVVTAMALLVVSGGILLPVRNSIASLEASVDSLDQSSIGDSGVPEKLELIGEQLEQLQAGMDDREWILCPDTPGARNEFENALHRQIESAGLDRVSMDRQDGVAIAGVPSFTISLIVEGDAFQLHEFLQGLEQVRWLTRVLTLEIQPGSDERRIKMKIAVLLEDNS
jgi:hypothetical protein